MKDSGKLVVRELFDVLRLHGVNDIICSPGSRNIPLLMGAHARPDMKKITVVDERSAAFIALGMAQVQKRPIALICTSGTALLNYAPGVAEAFYQGLPLIVISADRPKEWIDQDDSQTLQQYGVLKNFVKESYDISDYEVTEEKRWYANRIFNEAIMTALRPKEGPVHLNIRLSPPLNETCESTLNLKDNELSSDSRKIEKWDFPRYMIKEESQKLASRLIGKKIIIVAGFLTPDWIINRHIKKFISFPNVAIMAETISNLHLPGEAYAIDTALCTKGEWSKEESDFLIPDIIISIGGALVSRMLKEYLRECAVKNPSIEHWSLGENLKIVDPFKCLTMKVEMPAGMVLNGLNVALRKLYGLIEAGKSGIEIDKDEIKVSNSYNEKWNDLKRKSLERIERKVKTSDWSEICALDYIFNHIDQEYNLHISNGTPIRYNQLLTTKLPHAVYCNRGVSGIEGSTSSAVGNNLISRIPTILVTGDMSASHDLGGLLCCESFNSDLKIVIINNSGGGIFRFVSSSRKWDAREEYLCKGQIKDFEPIAKSFGFTYYRIENLNSLKRSFNHFQHEKSRSLMEVIVPPSESAEILLDILNQTK